MHLRHKMIPASFYSPTLHIYLRVLPQNIHSDYGVVPMFRYGVYRHPLERASEPAPVNLNVNRTKDYFKKMLMYGRKV